MAAQELNLHGLAASDYPLSLLVCLLVTFGLRCSCEIESLEIDKTVHVHDQVHDDI